MTPANESGYHGTCDWGYCDHPANAMRQMDDGDWLPVCDEHSIPGEVGIVFLKALQDLYDDWQGPLTDAVKKAQIILQAARDSVAAGSAEEHTQ